MPEDGKTPSSDAPTGEQGQRPTPQNAPATPDAPVTPGAEVRDPIAKLTADNEAAQRIISKLQGQLKAHEQRVAEEELAKLGDFEKSQKQLADTQKALVESKREVATLKVQLLAREMKIRDPEAAAVLIAGSLNEDASNAEELLKDLLKKRDYLKEPEAQSAAQPAPQRQQIANPGRNAQSQPTQPGQMARFGRGQRLFGRPTEE